MKYRKCSIGSEAYWKNTPHTCALSPAADVTYTDALDFYAAVREASKRRIDGAETIHRSSRSNETEPTEKMLKRDVNSLLHGKRDGKVVIENIKPKAYGGFADKGGVHKASTMALIERTLQLCEPMEMAGVEPASQYAKHRHLQI